MTKPENFSEPSIHSEHGRRNFLSLSCLTVGTFLLPAELVAAENQEDDSKIASEVGTADSLGLYTNLLEEVRRLVLQRDARLIHVEKMTATDWLSETINRAKTLRSTLDAGATPTPEQIGDLGRFMSNVASGGAEIYRGLVRMRQQPLEDVASPDAITSSTYLMLADRYTSNGAPSLICVASLPDDPGMKVTWIPVSASNAGSISFMANTRSEAPATLIDSPSGALDLPHPGIANATAMATAMRARDRLTRAS